MFFYFLCVTIAGSQALLPINNEGNPAGFARTLQNLWNEWRRV